MTETQYLRFADEAEWRQAAQEAGILTMVEVEDDEGNVSTSERWMFYTMDWAVDVIGTIYNDDGVYDEEGNEVTPPTAVPGFHVNAKWMNEPTTRAVAATITKPATPHRIFLGD